MIRFTLLALVLTLLSFTQLACQTANSVAPSTVASSPVASSTPAASSASAAPLKHEDLVVGEGRRAMWGGKATVQYVGKLLDGTVVDEGKLEFNIGDKTIIKGFNIAVGGSEGLDAMKVGGKRKVVLTPDMAYGATGDGRKIPPNATLTFEIELLKMQGGMGF